MHRDACAHRGVQEEQKRIARQEDNDQVAAYARDIKNYFQKVNVAD